MELVFNGWLLLLVGMEKSRGEGDKRSEKRREKKTMVIPSWELLLVDLQVKRRRVEYKLKIPNINIQVRL